VVERPAVVDEKALDGVGVAGYMVKR